MNIEDDFMWVAGNAFSEMRLMVEGAITLFEDDAGVLCRLAREAQKNEAQLALNDIGTALYSFRNHIRTLQAAHHKVATQEPGETEEAQNQTFVIYITILAEMPCRFCWVCEPEKL